LVVGVKAEIYKRKDQVEIQGIPDSWEEQKAPKTAANSQKATTPRLRMPGGAFTRQKISRIIFAVMPLEGLKLTASSVSAFVFFRLIVRARGESGGASHLATAQRDRPKNAQRKDDKLSVRREKIRPRQKRKG